MPRSLIRNPAGCAAFLLPLVAVLHNKAMPVVMIGLLAAVAYAEWPWRLRFWPPLLAAIAALLAWCLLSAFWSIDPANSLRRFARLAPTIAGGVVLCAFAVRLDPAGRRDAARALAAGVLIASALGIFRQAWLMAAPKGAVADVLYEFPIYPFGSIVALSVFVLLATLEARPFPRQTLAAIAVGVVAVALCASESNKLAFLAGAGALAATRWGGRKAVYALAVALPVLFVALPPAVGALDLPARIKAQEWIIGGSIGHRMIIWRYASDKIRARPLLGWGLFSARLLPDRENRAEHDPHYADILEVTWFSPGAKVELMPLHPHNATLQLALELGAVGALLYAPLYALCLFGLLRVPQSPWALASGTGLVAATFVIGQLSYSVWQSWWLCVQFMAGALYLFVARRTAPQSG